MSAGAGASTSAYFIAVYDNAFASDVPPPPWMTQHRAASTSQMRPPRAP
jgi:hypothetical protein